MGEKEDKEKKEKKDKATKEVFKKVKLVKVGDKEIPFGSNVVKVEAERILKLLSGD